MHHHDAELQDPELIYDGHCSFSITEGHLANLHDVENGNGKLTMCLSTVE